MKGKLFAQKKKVQKIAHRTHTLAYWPCILRHKQTTSTIVLLLVLQLHVERGLTAIPHNMYAIIFAKGITRIYRSTVMCAEAARGITASVF